MKYASSGAVLAATSKNTGAKVEFVKIGTSLNNTYQTWLSTAFNGILSGFVIFLGITQQLVMMSLL